MKGITFGALKSPIDKRDYIAEIIYRRNRKSYVSKRSENIFPDNLDLRHKMSKIRHQGNQGTCAAQTVTAIKEFQEKKDVGLTNSLSPQFVYNLRSNYPDEGMYGRDVMKILTNNGICLEVTYPYGTIEPKDSIDNRAIEEAKRYTIKGYARVSSIDGLKESLFKNGPCYISFPAYNNTGQFWIQRDEDTPLGGHAVCVVGYDENGFIIRNSWGLSWNRNGHTIYPYDQWGVHWEIWTTIDQKSIKYEYPDDTVKCQCTVL